MKTYKIIILLTAIICLSFPVLFIADSYQQKAIVSITGLVISIALLTIGILGRIGNK